MIAILVATVFGFTTPAFNAAPDSCGPGIVPLSDLAGPARATRSTWSWAGGRGAFGPSLSTPPGTSRVAGLRCR